MVGVREWKRQPLSLLPDVVDRPHEVKTDLHREQDLLEPQITVYSLLQPLYSA
jgi:hypothetical protein